VLLVYQQQGSGRGVKHHRGVLAESEVAHVARRALAIKKMLCEKKRERPNGN
jgi:hypothetical protein